MSPQPGGAQPALRISLFWRTFLMLATLLVASLAATLLAVRIMSPAPEQRLAWEIATVLNLTRSALVSADAERRLTLLDELVRDEGVRVLPLEPGDRISASGTGPRLRAIEPLLRQMLGEPTQVAGRVNGVDGVWVSFGIEGDAYWLVLPRDRIERQFGPSLQMLGAMVVALSVLGALLLSRLVNGPLSALARALSAISRGERPAALPETGPSEIVSLNRRFNRMASDLAALEHDRTLALAGISHDIRSPLARLRMEIELAQLDDSQRDAMADDIDRIDRIVGQFIEYARIAQPLRATDVEVSDLVATLTEAYRSSIQSGALELSASVPDSLTWSGNPVDLSRALGNLIDNAMRYGASADGVARVILRARSDSGGTLVLEVEDRGPGVSESERARLVRPFERLESERGHSVGAGLGLAIVERLARRYGGQLSLLAARPHGLLVRLELPAARLPAPPSGRQVSTTPGMYA